MDWLFHLEQSTALALTALCAIAVCSLLWFEARDHNRGRTITKPLAALAFVGVGLARASSGDPDYAHCMLIGLVLGAAGDVALMLRGRRAFAIGLGLFFLGHIAYGSGLSHLRPASEWLSLLALIPLTAAVAVAVYLWPHLGRLRPALVVYIAAFATVEAAALSVAGDGDRGALVAVGTSLFFVSDIAVARQRFVVRSLTNKLWGLPAYFTGQLLIAWSLGAS